MAKKEIKRYSLEFGKKEKVLNYATQTYQLSRPNKVGAVMALIRECQPNPLAQFCKPCLALQKQKTESREQKLFFL